MAHYQEITVMRIQSYTVTIHYIMNGIKEAVTIAAQATTTAEAISQSFKRSVRSPDLLDHKTVIESIDVKANAHPW